MRVCQEKPGGGDSDGGKRGNFFYINTSGIFFVLSYAHLLLCHKNIHTYTPSLTVLESHSVAQDDTELSSPVESALQVLRLSLSHCSGL